MALCEKPPGFELLRPYTASCQLANELCVVYRYGSSFVSLSSCLGELEIICALRELYMSFFPSKHFLSGYSMHHPN